MRISIALLLGLGAGLLLRGSEHGFAAMIVRGIEPVGTIWVNGIRMTVIPLVVSLLIVGIATPDDRRGITRLGIHSLIFFLLTLSVAALFSALVTPPIFTFLQLDAEGVSALRATAAATDPIANLPGFQDWLVTLIPTNPVKAASDGALLPLVIFTIVFACAIAGTSESKRAALLGFFRGVSEAMLLLVSWVLAVAPIGVFALALALAARLGLNALGAIGFYIGVVIALHLVMGSALYPIAALGGRIPVRRFARAAAPAQAVAFSSRSSFAALPALIEGATRELRLPAAVAAFVLPLAVSTYRLTSPLYWPVGAAFVARLYGVEFGLPQAAIIAAAAVILTTSAPGIPSGGLFIQAPLYANLGLPVEGLGILIAIDTIPDMFKTTLNVTAQMAAAAVVARTASDTA